MMSFPCIKTIPDRGRKSNINYRLFIYIRGMCFGLCIGVMSCLSCATGWNAERITPPPLLMPRTQVAYAGGDGYSIDTSIVINNVSGNAIRLQAEKLWLIKQYGFADVREKAVQQHADRTYDVLSCGGTDGVARTIYFDVTALSNRLAVGYWRIVDEHGNIRDGELDGRIWRVGEKIWPEIIGQVDGLLTYQMESFVGSGSLVVGRVESGLPTGQWRYFNMDGSQMLTMFRNGEKDGIEISWYPDGRLWANWKWKQGKLHGECTTVQEDGRIVRGVYSNGNMNRNLFYDINGVLRRESIHDERGLPEKVKSYRQDGSLFGVLEFRNEEPWDGDFLNSVSGEVSRYRGGTLVEGTNLSRK